MTGSGHVVFTVFTPTYNRAHTLHRVYESLCIQTLRTFEWLIVDDGSTDGTEKLVKEWMSEGRLDIRYIKQANQGKHIAFNTGVANARGELLLAADDDDRFKPKALERFLCHWRAIPEEEQNAFAGATCLCETERGELVGTRFPRDVVDSDSAEIHFRYKVKGEKWGFQRTAVLKEFPFPIGDKKKGYTTTPENVVWLRIASRYKTRYFNECLRIYHIHDEGETATRTPCDPSLLALGILDSQGLVLNLHWKYFKVAPLVFIGCALRYGRFAMHGGVGMQKALAALEKMGARGLVFLLWPVAFLVFLRDRRLGKI